MAGEIDGMIASLEKLAKLGEDAAKHAAPFVDEAVKATAKAGTTPDGDAWKPKKDGGRALVHAADALSTKARGDLVTVTLRSPETFHNFSKKHKRQILPDAGAEMPRNVVKALKKAADKAFDEASK